MKLDGNYYITTDSNNVVLNYDEDKGLNKETGKHTIYHKEWYYGNMKKALEGYIHRVSSQNKDVEDLLGAIEGALDVVRELKINN